MNPHKMNQPQSHPTCVGTGLVALDVVISSDIQNQAKFLTGGSCGNVLTILSYLGWRTFPIARLSANTASELLISDLRRWGVSSDLMTFTEDGSTPIIIHRILRDKQGFSKHRFEFKNPEDGKYLPSYKPYLSRSVGDVIAKGPTPGVYYFDRVNRASIDLAKIYKEQGAIIFFEPSNTKDESAFHECLQIADIVKFAEDRIPNYAEMFEVGQSSLEIQTCGEYGLKYRRRNSRGWTQVPGFSVDGVIDTAGAGDWCSAGIISFLFSSKNSFKITEKAVLEEAFKFGQALSALNCTYEGARGLMYALQANDLLSQMKSILTTSSNKINLRGMPETVKENSSHKALKISALLTSV